MLPYTFPNRQLGRAANDGVLGNMLGQAHFVLPTTDYASYDAFNWTKNHKRNVYESVTDALSACVAGRMDHIVLLPGTHTVTASLAMSKAGVSIWGPEMWAGLGYVESSAAILTTSASDEVMNVTAANCALKGLTLRPITAKPCVDFSAAGNALNIDGCFFDLETPAVNVATVGIAATGAARFRVTNSIFHSDGAQGQAIVATATVRSLIQGNRFHVSAGSWASVILCGAATTGLHIDNNLFTCSGTAMTVGIDGTGATIAGGVHITRNINGVLVTKLVDGFDATEAELGINYICTDTGGTGGTLVTLTT